MVKPEAIFVPVSVLALWTGIVLLMTGGRRVLAVRARRIDGDDFKLGESDRVPPDVAVVNRNFMNLLEMPVLFYVACILFFVTRHVGRGALGMAWAYVALRLVHSLIHLGPNWIRVRLLIFATSNFVLIAMWIRFVRTLL